MSDYLYRVDPDTGDARRFYHDGAALVVSGQPHPLGFWTVHPSVDRVTGSVDEDGVQTVRIWLKSQPLPQAEATDKERPARPADFEFFGGGLMKDGFWQSHPSIAHFEILNFLGDDSADEDSWNARVWLQGN